MMKPFNIIFAIVIAAIAAHVYYTGEPVDATAVAVYLVIDAIAIALRSDKE
ncbi:hypothetical protein PHYNN_84 [Pantoea phage Phynn]|nr:hypothetical protein PHYNN_84 [Pantoea phage Phynn]